MKIITPDSDPGRWLPEEAELFRAGKCSEQIEYGMARPPQYCGEQSMPNASFGKCVRHLVAD